MRISREKLYGDIATLFSQRSTCGRLQVGCVIERDGRIICTGYNGSLSSDRVLTLDDNSGQSCNCDLNQPCGKAIHAEANAISFAAKFGIALDNSTLYVTHSPCLKCAELIVQAGISKVLYKELFRNDDGLLFLIKNNISTSKC